MFLPRPALAVLADFSQVPCRSGGYGGGVNLNHSSPAVRALRNLSLLRLLCPGSSSSRIREMMVGWLRSAPLSARSVCDLSETLAASFLFTQMV